MRLLPFIFAMLFLNVAGAADPIWEARIRQLGTLGLPYFYNDEVQANIDAWLRNEKQATAEIAGRQAAISDKLEKMGQTHGLPWFVRYIPAANSGLNPRFVDADGSTGIWPLNFSIGKKYGLRQNSLLDERRSFDLSSEAACRYLKDLNLIYKDWLKTIVAFRIGAVRVNQLIRLSGSLKFDDIYAHMSQEEKTPVLQFYAAVAVLHYLNETDLKATPPEWPESDTVSVNCQMAFSYFSEQTGISTNTLALLNPEFKTDVIPWFAQPTVLSVPVSSMGAFSKVKDSLCIRLEIISKPPVVYDTIVKVVDSVTYIEIKPRSERSPEPVVTPGPGRPQVQPAPRPQPAPPAKVWVYYKVKSGDGFYTLSDIFDCSIAELKAWNGIRNNKLIAGTTLKFYVPSSRKAYYQQINNMNQAQKRNLALKD